MRILRQKDTGTEVKFLQELLNKKLVPSPHLVPDGDFGPKTAEAVVRFQTLHKLTPDAVVGPKTWGALGGSGRAVTPGVPPAPGETWQEVISYLNRKGIRHWIPQHNQTTGGHHATNSYHYHGTAVDLDPSPTIFKALEPLAVAGHSRVIAELFLDAPGCGFYKHGGRLHFVPDHKNHLHVALEVGKHMPPG